MSGRGSGSCLIRCRGCETKVFILALKEGKGREGESRGSVSLCFVAEVFYR